MEKWNFDVLFTGQMDEQIKRTATFLRGTKRLAQKAEESFADHVLDANYDRADAAFKGLVDLKDALDTLHDDPRFKEVQQASDAKAQKETEEQLTEMILNAVRRQ